MKSPERPVGHHREHMVFTQASDGLALEGLCVAPEGGAKGMPIVLLHGLHLRFCEPEYVSLARFLAASGHVVVLANTRGQGLGVWLRGKERPLLAGSGWEFMQDCVHDIDAWLRWLATTTGSEKVALLGHGYGGAKAVYHAALRRDPRIAALVLASSASLIREKFDNERTEDAEAHVRAGRGDALLPRPTGRMDAKHMFSAEVIVNRQMLARELYGSASTPPALSQVEAPILATFGEREQGPGRDVRGFLESIQRNAVRSLRCDTALIVGADYFYTGRESALADRISAFLASVDGAAAAQEGRP